MRGGRHLAILSLASQRCLISRDKTASRVPGRPARPRWPRGVAAEVGMRYLTLDDPALPTRRLRAPRSHPSISQTSRPVGAATTWGSCRSRASRVATIPRQRDARIVGMARRQRHAVAGDRECGAVPDRMVGVAPGRQDVCVLVYLIQRNSVIMVYGFSMLVHPLLPTATHGKRQVHCEARTVAIHAPRAGGDERPACGRRRPPPRRSAAPPLTPAGTRTATRGSSPSRSPTASTAPAARRPGTG